MKSNICVFIGSGDLAVRSASLLGDLGLSLYGVCRNPDALPSLFKGIEADYTQLEALNFLELLAPDFLIVTFKPLKPDLSGYKQGFVNAAQNLIDGLGKHIPNLVIFVSSTRIFAENDGRWINELSPRTKTDPLGKSIVEAEELLSGAGLPLVSLYCSGLYGFPTDYLVKRVKEGVFTSKSEKFFTNRIHRQDVAGVFAWLIGSKLNQERLQSAYIVSDSYPASRMETELWLSEKLGLSEDDRKKVDVLPTRGGNKRCDNGLLLTSGYKLLYPDFKSGYGSILEQLD